jgi:hypothetical protein
MRGIFYKFKLSFVKGKNLPNFSNFFFQFSFSKLKLFVKKIIIEVNERKSWKILRLGFGLDFYFKAKT